MYNLLLILIIDLPIIFSCQIAPRFYDEDERLLKDIQGFLNLLPQPKKQEGETPANSGKKFSYDPVQMEVMLRIRYCKFFANDFAKKFFCQNFCNLRFLLV